MEMPTRRQLLDMAEAQGGPFVSIYLPTHRGGAETRENPIRYKNLVTSAENQLLEGGMDKSDVERLLAGPRNLIDDYGFWQDQRDGLALYASAEAWDTFRMPLDLPEECRVGSRYYLKPLISLLSESHVYYALGLSANQTRLLRCTAFTEERLQLDDMPASMADALWADDPEKQLQFRSAGVHGHAFFHGAGGSEPDVKDEYLRYFQQVDAAVAPFLKRGDQPLVLACVDYLAPIYREANTYPRLVDGNVGGNPDRERDEDVREDTWQVLQPQIQRELENDLERYANLAGTGKTSDDPAIIALAALEGRVDTIFINPSVSVWGTVDAVAHSVEAREERQRDDEDLVDYAVTRALGTSSTIHGASGEILQASGVAAIFRY